MKKEIKTKRNISILVILLITITSLSFIFLKDSTPSITGFAPAEHNSPNTPTLNLPINNDFISATFALLNWTTTDPNGVNMTCHVYGDTSTDPSTFLNATNITSGGIGTFNWTGLTENVHYWKARCDNGTANSSWSSVSNFTIDLTTPTSVELLAPADNAITKNQSPLLNWTANTEQNLKNYTIYVDDSGTFNTINFTYYTPNNSFFVADSWPVNKTWVWKVTAEDKAGNKNFTTKAFRYIIDTYAPNITGETVTPSVVFINTSPVINATIIEENIEKVWVSGNWSGAWQNITVTGTGESYQFTIGSGNLTSQKTYAWRFYTNDSLGNMTNGSLQTFTVSSRSPPESVNLLTPPNNSVRAANNIQFSWTESTDIDNDTITYELEVGKDSSFSSYDLIVTDISTQSLSNLFTNNTLTNGTRYIRVRAYDQSNYSDYSPIFILNSTAASINFTSPLNNSEHNAGNALSISISELEGGDWISSLIIEIDGQSLTNASFGTEWTLNYTPSNAGIYNITAYGYNDTASINTTALATIRVTNTSASQPNIQYICSNETYATNNTNVTIKLKATLETLSNYSNITINTPSDTTINLSIDRTEREGLTYTYYSSYFINETGDYTLLTYVVDIENNQQSKNFTFTSYTNGSATKNITLTGHDIETFHLKDICTNDRIAAGNNFSIINGSVYSIEVETAKPLITFVNVNLTNHTYLLNYTELYTLNYTELGSRISPPSEKRNILEFQAITNMTSYENISISYDYSALESALEDESALVLYSCQDLSETTFTLLSSTLDTTKNTISSNFILNGTIYLIAEDQTTIRTETGRGGPIPPPTRREPIPPIASIELLAPEPLTLEPDEVLATDIILRNNGKAALYNISLTGSSDDPSITFELSKTFYNKLTIGQEDIIKIDVTSFPITIPGRYSIEIQAQAESPAAEDSVTLYIDVMEKDFRKKDIVIKEIHFAADLFKEHPECLEFEEAVREAEKALDQGAYDNATIILNNVVEGCQLLITKEYKPSIPLLAKRRLSNITIFTIEMVIIALLGAGMWSYYQRRKEWEEEEE